jgi:hypothetical protein
MRAAVLLSCSAVIAMSSAASTTAQVYRFSTPVPAVTAAGAEWQIDGEPIFYAGAFYYPTGPTVYLDSSVMVRTASYRGVPLYEDTTKQPYSVVYVPIGGAVMRPYERRRDGVFTGTLGSTVPSFPTETDAELSTASANPEVTTPPVSGIEPSVEPETELAVGTAGTLPPRRAAEREAPAPAATQSNVAPARRNFVQSFPSPTENLGIWIAYGGARWFRTGSAITFDERRFVQVGDYFGFPVYRDKNGPDNTIYIPAVHGGALTPYRR